MDRPWIKHIPSGNPIEIDIPEISLTELFFQSVEQYSDNTAITFMEKRYTYSELGKLVKKCARLLADEGIGKEIVWLSCFLIVPNIQLVFLELF